MQLCFASKTVTWEEEVPLNTGDNIFVKRSVDYVLKGGAGNPFDISYRPELEERIEFNWQGKKYIYIGDAQLILVAISPKQYPILVASAIDGSWDWRHNYYCTTPHYVQFIPDATGKKWTWPSEIEIWLYNIPANLMRQRRKPEEMKQHYTAQQKYEEDKVGNMQSPSHAKIDPTFGIDSRECKKRN